jgi:hypothetical protein
MQAALEDAWDTTQTVQNQSLRVTLRQFESAARAVLSGGALSSVGANGRSSAWSIYGPGSELTPQEVVKMWRDLINAHDIAKAWLNWCALYGLDPLQAELDHVSDAPGPAVQNPAAMADADIFEWLMGSIRVDGSVRAWPGKIQPITECRSDYRSMRQSSVPFA